MDTWYLIETENLAWMALETESGDFLESYSNEELGYYPSCKKRWKGYAEVKVTKLGTISDFDYHEVHLTAHDEFCDMIAALTKDQCGTTCCSPYLEDNITLLDYDAKATLVVIGFLTLYTTALLFCLTSF